MTPNRPRAEVGEAQTGQAATAFPPMRAGKPRSNALERGGGEGMRSAGQHHWEDRNDLGAEEDQTSSVLAAFSVRTTTVAPANPYHTTWYAWLLF